jgi:hypothetical protein
MAKPIFVMEIVYNLSEHSEEIFKTLSEQLPDYHVILMGIPDGVPKCYVLSEAHTMNVHNIDICAWDKVK